MSEDIIGTCLCGSVRLSCGQPAGNGGYCHCVDCRKATGSAFSVNIPFNETDFRVTHGAVKSFTKVGDSGNELTRYFCPNCGSPLFGTSPQHPGRVYVRAGILDDPARVQPASQSWTSSRVAWADIDSSLPSYSKGKA